MIPINGLTILSKAIVLTAFSAIDGMIVVTKPVPRSVVIISHDTRAASPPVPSWSSAIPTPTPITKSSAMWSINAAPAFTKNKPKSIFAPVISPPCIVAGHSMYPIPIKRPHNGRTATGSMRALPSFCKNFIHYPPSIPPTL